MDTVDLTSSVILPDNTVELLHESLFDILEIDKALICELPVIDHSGNIITILSEFTFLTDAYAIIEDAITNNEAVNVDELASAFVDANVSDEFSFVIPKDILGPDEELALTNYSIEFTTLVGFNIPDETFSIINHALINNEAVNVDELVSTILDNEYDDVDGYDGI